MAKEIILYYSSATSSLKFKKDTTAVENLLAAKKAQYTKVDLATMDKTERDAVFAKSGTKNIPLLFVDGQFLGEFETLEYLEEVGELAAKLQ